MTTRRRRPWGWLVVAALLLAAGAWLMRGAEPPERAPAPPVSLPTRMTRGEKARAEARQTWVAPPSALPDAGPVVARPRDPVLALMPPSVEHGAVVAELNAIVNSDLGGLLLDCLGGASGGLFDELRDAGLDPATSLDRMALVDDALVLTGDFRGDGWRRFVPAGATSRGHGRQGELLGWTSPDGGSTSMGVWGGQLLVLGDDEGTTRALLDRLEGTGPSTPGVLSDAMAYGEVYGVLKPAALAELLGEVDPQLGGLLRQSAEGLELHLDVTRDVGLVADVTGADASKTEELRRALGSALSLARMNAQARGEADDAALLDLAHVRSAEGGTQFRLEAGLPYEYVKQSLEACVQRRRARRTAPRDGGA